jgi:hypothetical protein
MASPYQCPLCDEPCDQLVSGQGYYRVCYDCSCELEDKRKEDDAKKKAKP